MKLKVGRTILIGLAFMSICAFWQTYDNIIPLMLQKHFGFGETITGVLMAMDNVFALFLLPLFGALSDKTETRFGKRIPFIVVGTFLAVICYMLLPAFANGKNLVLFLIFLFGVLLAMGLYRSPAVALMPDLTPAPLRSKANALINLMGAVGGVYGLVMIKVLVKPADLPDYTALFASIAAFMVISVLLLIFTINEKKIKTGLNNEYGADAFAETEGEADDTQSAVDMSASIKKSMIYLLASVFLWFTAYNAVTTAFSRYAVEVWKLEGGSFADCLLVATVAAIISYIPIGALSSTFGRKKVIMSGIALMILGYGSVFFCTEFAFWINISFVLVGFGWAAISVNSYPMVVEMAQGSDIGKYTGTYYTFSMAAQIFTPVFSGFLLEYVSYKVLFPYAVIFMLFAAYTMTQVKHGDVRPVKKDSLLEHFDVDD